MCFWKGTASTMNSLHVLILSLLLVYLSASLLCPHRASFSPVSSVWASREPPSDWTEWLRRLASATKQLINSGHSASEWAHILSSDEKLPEVRLGRAATAGRCSGTSQGLDKRPPEDPRWTKKKANAETKTEFVTKQQQFTNIMAGLIKSGIFNVLSSWMQKCYLQLPSSNTPVLHLIVWATGVLHWSSENPWTIWRSQCAKK